MGTLRNNGNDPAYTLLEHYLNNQIAFDLHVLQPIVLKPHKPLNVLKFYFE